MPMGQEMHVNRGIAIDFVREFLVMHACKLSPQHEDELREAVEGLLDEGEDLLVEVQQEKGEAENKLTKLLDNTKALASWLRQVLDLVKRDPLGSTAECPCCGDPLEDGEHYECDLFNLLRRDEIGG